MADSFELKAIITAVDKLSGPLKGMQRQLKGFQKEMSGLSVGAGAMGVTILGAIAGATKQAIDFEKSMADVRKVVDELESPKAFLQMQDEILDLSTKIPLAATEIADIVAQAGQSGISRSELTQFASDAAKIGVAWDLSGKEAGKTLAVWRTAFGLTQKEVVDLADKVNYLGNTGPANAASISQVVTELGGVAKSAHVASADVAALASTIIGVGINGDVAKTGIKNLFSGLTSATSGRQKAVAEAIGWSPDALAKGMVKDARGTIIKVLAAVNKLPEWKKPRAMEFLFGKESAEAIVPLMTNLDTLRKNFDKVTNRQQYGGAAAKEYATAADTAAADLAILKNQVSQISVEIGREFLPIVRDAAKELMPLLKSLSQFIKDNPEAVRAVAKFGVALLGVSASIGAVSRAVKIMNFAFNMSPAKLVIGALVLGAYEIIEHWDEVGPVIKEVWNQVDEVAQALGGWEAVAGGVGLFMAGRFATQTVGTLTQAVTAARELSTLLGGIAKLGVLGIQITIAIEMFKQLKELSDTVTEHDHTSSFWESLKGRFQAGGWHNYDQQKTLAATGQNPVSIPQARAGARLSSPMPYPLQRQELTVKFENVPPGTRVGDIPKTGNPLMTVKTDVGYSPFRKTQ